MSEDTLPTAVPSGLDAARGLALPTALPKAPRRAGKVLRRQGEAVYEDAKRSISVRISTSDYGRIKVASRHMRIRESEVFRYLVGAGMSRLIKVLEGRLAEGSRYQLLVRVAAEWRLELGLPAVETAALLGCLGDQAPLALDDADLLLVDLAATRPAEAAALLGLRLGGEVEEGSVVDRLGDYLARKYEGEPANRR